MLEKIDSFLSADTLGIEETERKALLRVLEALEGGQLVYDPTCSEAKRGFNFASVVARHGDSNCACILGWAKLLSGDEVPFEMYVSKLAFDPVRRILPLSRKLDALLDLFFGPLDRKWELNAPKPEQAEQALRNYLTTGLSRWNEVMGASNGVPKITNPD